MPAIIPIPAFSDNYIWLLREGGRAAVVDRAMRRRCSPSSRRTTIAITSAASRRSVFADLREWKNGFR